MMTAVPVVRALAVQAPAPAAQAQDREVRVLVQVKDGRRGAKVARADLAIGRRRPVDQVVPVGSVIDLRLLEVLVRIVDRVLAGRA